ncbi:MAG: peptidase C1A papain [Casimicrobiaceae bacterium]
MYTPQVEHAPAQQILPPPPAHHPVLNQASTDACTGFGLATVIHVLLSRRDRKLAAQVAPFMLYGMARHYDNLPGTGAANGSSCRGALKAWFKHGACELDFWPKLAEPKATGKVDWWDDGVRRPLGAYYRVERRSVVDMQAALNDAAVLYVSADTHPGWDIGSRLTAKRKKSTAIWKIPFGTPASGGGGHAFAIIGYTADGFIIQNSWGKDWGSKGLAVLTYADWLINSWDCWVAQLGVVTRLHEAAAEGNAVLRHGVHGVHTGVIDIHAISPHVVDTGNNGELSQTGQFHTTPGDLDELVTFIMPDQRQQWGIPANQKMDVVLYAHGGLVSEQAAANTAATWIGLLKDQQIFPIFFMWESGIVETIEDEIKNVLGLSRERPTGGPLDAADAWWSDRLEGSARVIAKPLWDRMKQNARLITQNPLGGANLLFQRLDGSRSDVRLHLVGHSAGAIIHAYLADWLVAQGWTIESLSLLAPACRTDVFAQFLLPHLQSGKIARMAQFHLSDPVEDNEGGMRVALGYKRSLLYMISNGLEEARNISILGMQKYFNRDVAPLNLANVQVRVAPSSLATDAAKHGAFDDDSLTQGSVIANIENAGMPSP